MIERYIAQSKSRARFEAGPTAYLFPTFISEREERRYSRLVKMSLAVVLHELALQFLNHSIEHRKRPPPLEDALRRLIVSWLALVSLFAGREFQRHHRPAPSFMRAPAVFFIGHEEFQGSQNKRAAPPLFWLCAIRISPFEHVHEELLRQILGFVGRITSPVQIRVQRIPVVLT